MTPSEERALSALLTSKTKLEAAEKAGITDRTLRRYFENPEFCQRVREAFVAVSQDATNRPLIHWTRSCAMQTHLRRHEQMRRESLLRPD